jgi:hypothetical protein
VAEAIDYMLKRWDGFTSFLEDGRICLTNNAAERALRGFALGRKSSHDRPSTIKGMRNRRPLARSQNVWSPAGTEHRVRIIDGRSNSHSGVWLSQL